MENKLTAEQMEKLKACKTVEEAKALAEKENIDLTDKQLKEVAGGVIITHIDPYTKAGHTKTDFLPIG